MERVFALVDRLTALAPLAVLVILLGRADRRHDSLVDVLEAERIRFREERRELINRVQFPYAMPVATRPVDQVKPAASQADELAQRRGAWGGVGTAEPPFIGGLPGDSDDAPGAEPGSA